MDTMNADEQAIFYKNYKKNFVKQEITVARRSILFVTMVWAKVSLGWSLDMAVAGTIFVIIFFSVSWVAIAVPMHKFASKVLVPAVKPK